MKFPITKVLNIAAGIIIGFVILCADGLMETLGGWFLPVCLLLMSAAYGALWLREQLGRRYILIGRRSR